MSTSLVFPWWYTVLMCIVNPKRSSHLWHSGWPWWCGGAPAVVPQGGRAVAEEAAAPVPLVPDVRSTIEVARLTGELPSIDSVQGEPGGATETKASAETETESPPTTPTPPTQTDSTAIDIHVAEADAAPDSGSFTAAALLLPWWRRYGLLLKLMKLFCIRLWAECLGTGVLVFSIGFAAIESELTQEGVIRSAHSRRTQDTPALDARRLVDQVGGALAAGLTLVFLVYMLGNSSGAHLNPCATLASTLRGAFPPMWLPFYCLAQFTGAVVASAVLRALYGATAQFATPAVNAAYSDAKGMGVEAVATFILITTFLAMIQRGGNIGQQAALAVGFCFTSLELLCWSFTGGSLNPFRALAPALVNGPLRGQVWVYVVGPLIGSSAAVLAARLFMGKLKENDYAAVQGLAQPVPDDL